MKTSNRFLNTLLASLLVCAAASAAPPSNRDDTSSPPPKADEKGLCPNSAYTSKQNLELKPLLVDLDKYLTLSELKLDVSIDFLVEQLQLKQRTKTAVVLAKADK